MDPPQRVTGALKATQPMVANDGAEAANAPPVTKAHKHSSSTEDSKAPTMTAQPKIVSETQIHAQDHTKAVAAICEDAASQYLEEKKAAGGQKMPNLRLQSIVNSMEDARGIPRGLVSLDTVRRRISRGKPFGWRKIFSPARAVKDIEPMVRQACLRLLLDGQTLSSTLVINFANILLKKTYKKHHDLLPTLDESWYANFQRQNGDIFPGAHSKVRAAQAFSQASSGCPSVVPMDCTTIDMSVQPPQPLNKKARTTPPLPMPPGGQSSQTVQPGLLAKLASIDSSETKWARGKTLRSSDIITKTTEMESSSVDQIVAKQDQQEHPDKCNCLFHLKPGGCQTPSSNVYALCKHYRLHCHSGFTRRFDPKGVPDGFPFVFLKSTNFSNVLPTGRGSLAIVEHKGKASLAFMLQWRMDKTKFTVQYNQLHTENWTIAPADAKEGTGTFIDWYKTCKSVQPLQFETTVSETMELFKNERLHMFFVSEVYATARLQNFMPNPNLDLPVLNYDPINDRDGCFQASSIGPDRCDSVTADDKISTTTQVSVKVLYMKKSHFERKENECAELKGFVAVPTLRPSKEVDENNPDLPFASQEFYLVKMENLRKSSLLSCTKAISQSKLIQSLKKLNGKPLDAMTFRPGDIGTLRVKLLEDDAFDSMSQDSSHKHFEYGGCSYLYGEEEGSVFSNPGVLLAIIGRDESIKDDPDLHMIDYSLVQWLTHIYDKGYGSRSVSQCNGLNLYLHTRGSARPLPNMWTGPGMSDKTHFWSQAWQHPVPQAYVHAALKPPLKNAALRIAEKNNPEFIGFIEPESCEKNFITSGDTSKKGSPLHDGTVWEKRKNHISYGFNNTIHKDTCDKFAGGDIKEDLVKFIEQANGKLRTGLAEMQRSIGLGTPTTCCYRWLPGKKWDESCHVPHVFFGFASLQLFPGIDDSTFIHHYAWATMHFTPLPYLIVKENGEECALINNSDDLFSLFAWGNAGKKKPRRSQRIANQKKAAAEMALSEEDSD